MPNQNETNADPKMVMLRSNENKAELALTNPANRTPIGSQFNTSVGQIIDAKWLGISVIHCVAAADSPTSGAIAVDAK